MRSALAVLTLLGMATAAGAQERAAWERSSAWTCAAELTRICQGRSASCDVQAGTASFTIDFARNMFRIPGQEPRFDERITSRNFDPDGPLIIHEIHLSGGGGRVILFERTVPGQDPAALQAVMTASYPAFAGRERAVVTHFMRCRPS